MLAVEAARPFGNECLKAGLIRLAVLVAIQGFAMSIHVASSSPAGQ
jgi:hypothetical protein